MRDTKPSAPDEATLATLLERCQPVPSERFHRRMKDAPWTQPTTLGGYAVRRTRMLRAFAVTAVVAALAATLMLATPWGQAFAQNVLRFFNPAAEDRFAVTPGAGQDTPASEPTASPPEYMPVSEAEARIGFEVRQLPSDPTGLQFQGASVIPALQAIQLNYGCPAGGCGLFITQSRAGWVDSVWGQVPSSAAVQPVAIDGLPGEYVKGTYVVYPGAAEATWNPDASMQRLRWRDGEVFFEITLMGEGDVVARIDQDMLLQLAASLR